MESQHVDVFNHDPWAAGYDQDVQNEADPVRTGYGDVLAWVVSAAQIGPEDVVLDLGAGTGNTARLIAQAAQVVCVDISKKMIDLARPKLRHLQQVEFVQADLLGYFTGQTPAFNVVISTYAIHHLTEPEKARLFRLIWDRMQPGGRAVFGDLMVESAQAKEQLRAYFREQGDTETVEALEEEFFWEIGRAQSELTHVGFHVAETRRFSELSWAILAVKPFAKN